MIFKCNFICIHFYYHKICSAIIFFQANLIVYIILINIYLFIYKDLTNLID